MLKTYMLTVPPTKFVLIEDSLEDRGKKILDYLVENHAKYDETTIKYFVFEGNYKRVVSKLYGYKTIQFYDYTKNLLKPTSVQNFNKDILQLNGNDVVVLDSLAQMIFRYNLINTYRICSNLMYKVGVKQLVTVLHRDLIEKVDNTIQIFQNLSTLHLSLEPKFTSNDARIKYTCRKLGGKIIKAIEEYTFDGDNFITKKLSKPDNQKIEQAVTAQVNPENLSTFRIGLTESEKQSRDNLVLPYLPKKDTTPDLEQEGGQVFYTLDAEDDWDEEDPDDDLDI